MKTIRTIAQREFLAYFTSPIAYVFLIAFLVVTQWLFWRSFFVMGQNNLRGFFSLMPWVFLFFIPAIAMGRWAEEKKDGTIEILFTLPLKKWGAVLGKFLATLGLLTTALFLTSPMVATLALLGHLDFGPIVGGYLGLLFMGGAYLAIGLWVSSLTENQIIAFIVAVVITFILLLCGEPIFTTGLPPLAASFFKYLGLNTHFDSIERGVIDTRDCLYYLSLIFLFLYFNGLALEEPQQKKKKERGALVLSLLIAIFTLNLLASRHVARLDLTAQKNYTLAPATKKILKNLNDVVTIKVYFTQDLPPALANLKRDVDDMLAEFRQYGGSRVKVEYFNPQANPVEEQKVQMMGIPPIELNVLHKDKQELAKIYLGMTLHFASKQEVLAVVQNTGNLEYRLDAAFVKITEPKTPLIGWWTPSPSPTGDDFSMAKERLESRYTLQTIDEKSLDQLDPKTMPVLFFVVPEKLSDNEKKAFADYLEKGGKAIVLVERVAVAMGEGLKPTPRPNPLEALLKKYGIEVKEDMVLDKSNAAATFTGGVVNFVVPYPFWVAIRPENFDKEQPMVSELTNLILPWASSLQLTNQTILFKTTPFGVATGAMHPDKALDPQTANSIMTLENSGVIPMGALADQKLVVVGNTQFLKNQFLQQFPDNGTFLENAIDVFSTGEALIGVRSKGIVNEPIALVSDTARGFIKIVNTFIGPLLLLMAGSVIWWRRKRRSAKLRLAFQT